MGMTRQESIPPLFLLELPRLGGMRIHPGALVHGRVVLTPSVGGGPSTGVLASVGPRSVAFGPQGMIG